MVTFDLTPEQERRLTQHAAARNLTLPEALQALLDTSPPQHRPWTEAELEMLRNSKNKPRDIARQTGRTVTAVSVRRHKLAKDENRTDLGRADGGICESIAKEYALTYPEEGTP